MAHAVKKSAEDAKVACRNIRRDANKHFDDGREGQGDDRGRRATRARKKCRTLLKTYEDKIDEMARQEDQGNHGAVDRPAGRDADVSRSSRHGRGRRAWSRSADRGSLCSPQEHSHAHPPRDRRNCSPAPRPRPDRRGGRRQPAAVRRQPPHAAAARAALEEVPREVRRADHQDPARRRPAVDGRRLFKAPRSALGGRRPGRRRPSSSLALRPASSAQWVPSLLFASAVVLVRRRPGHRRTRRSRAWRSWSPSSWPPASPSSASTGATASSRCSTPRRTRSRSRSLRDGEVHTVAARRGRRRRPGRAGDGRRDPRRRPARQGDRAATSISR